MTAFASVLADARAVARLVTVPAQADLAYRAAVLIEMVGMVTEIALYAVVWRSLYGETGAGGTGWAGGSVAGNDRAGAVTYTTLGTLQYFAYYAPERQVGEALRGGSISYVLLRPVGYLTQLLAHDLGGFLWSLLAIAAGLATAVAFSVAALPASRGQFGLYGLSLLLAFLVQYHIRLLLALTAFWTTEVWGVQAAFHFATRILAGGIAPLWFFPDWFRSAAALLPFAGFAHAPLSIYIGRLTGPDAWAAIGLQVGWACALALAGAGLWRAAVRKLVVQGG